MPSIASKYVKGLNNDLGISKLSNDTLTDALNINITTDLGYSSYIVENQKGNNLSFTIPDLFRKILITIESELVGTGVIYNGPFGSGTPTNFAFPSGITTAQQLYDYFLATFPQFFPDKIQIFIKDDQLVLQQSTATIGFSLNDGLSFITLVPNQTNLSIIGWGQLDEELVMLTCPYSQDDPDPIGNGLSYYGQVWKIGFRNDSDEVINASYPLINGGAYLNPVYHLVYNGRLPFSRANEVYREMECRKEDSDTGNAYWTDNYSFPKVINTYNPNAQALDEGLLDWLPDAGLPIPILTQILEGGSLPVSKIQVTYQLVNFDGAVSNWSPFSNLVDLTDSSFSEAFQDYQGSPPTSDYNSNKTVQFRINGLDERYDFIRVAIIIYELPNIPQPYLVDEIPITEGTLTFNITGGEGLVPLTMAELITSQVPFDRVKTFTQKKNRLYPANVSSTKRKLDFDARAYRFGSTGNYQLFSRNGSFITGTGLDAQLLDLPDTHDAVNPYNDESGTVYGTINTGVDFITGYNIWLTSYQYKYQTNGSTLGGEGPNVSYTFGTDIYQGSNESLADTPSGTYVGYFAPFVSVDPNSNPPLVQAIGTGQQYNVSSPYNSIKSPYQSVVMKTCARGEIYRAGITGITTKGEETFTEWIGDIKIPEPSDDELFNLSRQGVADRIDLVYITINFNINTQVLFNQNPDIVAFKIVFVERKEGDKTRLSMGTVMAPLNERSYTAGDNFAYYNCGVIPQGETGANNAIPTLVLGANYKVNNSDPNDKRAINFGFLQYTNNPSIDPNPIDYRVLPIYKSPDIDFNPAPNSRGYYKEIQWYETVDDFPLSADPDEVYGIYPTQGVKYWQKDTGVTTTNWLSFATFFRYKNGRRPLNAQLERVHQINNQTLMGIDGFVPSSFSSAMSGIEYNHITKWWVDETNEDPSCSGVGSKALFTEVLNPFNPNQSDAVYETGVVVNPYKRIVSYCQFNFGAYGGPWRTNRYNNIYITQSTTVTKQEASNIQTIITPGDVFMVNYDCVLSAMHWSTTDTVDSNPFATDRGLATRWRKSDTMLATSLVFPTESSINTELRYGKHWAKDQNTGVDSDDFAQFLFDEFYFNSVYQQVNNAKTYISEPFNANFQTELPYTVYASQKKLDNESFDSWRMFRTNDFLTLEGTYGPINKIVNWSERIVALQDRATSQVSSEELGTVQDETGAVIQTGTGAILSRYDYLTKDSGTIHQHSVIVTPFGVNFFDARSKKVMRLTSEGNMALSDIKGLESFFRNNLLGDILTKDQVLLGLGVHGVYDTIYHRSYMTFEDKYYPIIQYTPQGQPVYQREPIIKTFTISYNETLQAFESFYSFQPQLYISLGRRLLSALPDANHKVYIHNKGEFGRYYDVTYPCYIEFIVNADPESKLTFRTDYLQFWTQVFDQLNNDIPFNTALTFRCSNDYQDTQTSLAPITNPKWIDRFERSWKVNWIRDYNQQDPRRRGYLKDKYLRIKVEYDNQQGYWFRLHDFNTFITASYPYDK